ncbi:MAG TPA: beta-ketoacyl synthase N-terminal-like domain-containing protein, partial [Thermoleophilaceae bacterium]
RGAALDWAAAAPPAGPALELPTYPFERRRHWLPEGGGDDGRAEPPAEEPEAVADPTGPEGELLVRLLDLPPPDRRPELVAHLRTEVAEVIGLDSPDVLEPHQGFFEVGMDSLMAMQLQTRLAEALDRELPATLALDHPTVDALADHLLAEVLAQGSHATARRNGARRTRDDPIAIVGMSCRFPGAPDLDAFWRLLDDGVDAVTAVPPTRWDADAFYDPDPDAPMRMNTRSGGFLDVPVDEFDAEMFGIAPREAAGMDPQQRLLLEVAWEALEDAGLPVNELSGTETGVFVGINTSDYMQLLSSSGGADIDPYVATGNTFSVAAGRVSYLLGLQGPSLALDTACSSSLVAAHLACQSLHGGECEAAVVGGVNLMLAPATSIGMAKLRALSPDGRCKTFDASADGYGRGEGCGVVVLKRLPDAVAAGDRIAGVIRGSAVNQDGRSAGLTVPNGPAQEALVRDALRRARVDPAQVGYVEAHGTGTPLGDPIELQALGAALGEGRDPERPLQVGSVKTNFGHLEAAAGVAGLIKVTLAMRHGRIPRHLHLSDPNPYIPWDELPIAVPTEPVDWPRGDEPRVAGISAFGFSGTNAHLVVAEPPPEAAPVAAPEPAPVAAPPETAPAAAPAERPDLLVLSARSPESLSDLAGRFATSLRERGDEFRDVCRSAALRRTHHAHRLAVAAASGHEAAERLAAFAGAGAAPGVVAGQPVADGRRLVFAYCGQGAQWVGMGRALAAAEPAVQATLARCDELIRDRAGWSPIEELDAPEARSRLGDTEIAQPVLFSLQLALTELWRSWSIRPDSVVGHSVGEVAAACVAGALDLEQAIDVVLARGRVMQPLKGRGAMAAIGLPPAEVEELLRAGVSVAAINSPSTTVVSGDTAAVEAVVAAAGERQAFARMLPGGYAFHSQQTAPCREPLVEALASLEPREPAIPVISTVTGRRAGRDDLDAEHWGRNVTDRVEFAVALDAACDGEHNLVVEIGPHPVLATAVTQCLAAAGKGGAAIASMRRGDGSRATALEALGALHVAGHPVDHRRLREAGRFVSIPTYAWQRRRHWLRAARVTEPGRRVD